MFGTSHRVFSMAFIIIMVFYLWFKEAIIKLASKA